MDELEKEELEAENADGCELEDAELEQENQVSTDHRVKISEV